jgi:hypothetical protein
LCRADRVPHRLRACGAVDGVALTSGPARQAIRGISGDRRPTVGARLQPLTVLASGLDATGSVVPLGEQRKRLRLVASAARLHAEKSTAIPHEEPA